MVLSCFVNDRYEVNGRFVTFSRLRIGKVIKGKIDGMCRIYSTFMWLNTSEVDNEQVAPAMHIVMQA